MVKKSKARKASVPLMIFILVAVLVLLMISAVFDSTDPVESSKELRDLVGVILPSFLVFASVWLTSYYLHLQLYSNRYPINIIKKYYQPNAILIIILIAIITVFGVYSMLTLGTRSQFAFVLVSVFCVVVLLFQSFYSSRTLMLNTYIKRYVNELVDSIRRDKTELQDAKSIYKHVRLLYCECLAHCEYYVCSSIHDELVQLFRVQLQECNKRSLGNGCVSQVESDFDDLIELMMTLIKEIQEKDPEYFMRQVMNLQAQNMIDVIKSGHYDLFKRYFKEFLFLTYHMTNSDKRSLAQWCYKAISKIVVYSLPLERLDYLSYCIEECESMSLTACFAEQYASIDYYAHMLTISLVECSDKDNEEALTKLFSAFAKCSSFAAQVRGSYETIIKYHLALFRSIANSKNEVLVRQYLDLINGTYRYLVEDENWTNCVYIFLDLIDEAFDGKWSKESDALKVQMLSLTISSSREANFINMPKYAETLFGGHVDDGSIQFIVDDFDLLIRKSMHNGRYGITYFLLEELNECILSLGIGQKSTQMALLDVYFKRLRYVNQLDNKNSLAICLDLLEKCLREMDKESLVSEDLGSYIVQELFQIAESETGDGIEPTSSLLDFLFSLMKQDREINFIYKKTALR